VRWCPFEGRCVVVPIRWSCSPWSFGGVVAIRWWSFSRLRQQWWPFSRLRQQWWSFSRLRQRWYNSLELSNRQEFHLFLHPIVMKCSSILSLLMFCKKIKFNAWHCREGYPYSSIYCFTLSRWVRY